MRILRALAAQVTLLLCVVGLPLLLAATIGNPVHGLGALREGQVNDAVVIDLLALLAYLCWTQFVIAVLTELAAALRHARPPAARPLPPPRRVPGVFAGQQHLAHSLVVAALLLLPTLSIADLPLHVPTVGPAPAPPTVTASWPQHTSTFSPPTATSPASEPHTNTQTATRTYLVPASGGPATYWDLATTFLGSGERWEQIWHLNEGRTQADGTVMDSPNLLRPGWTVLLPPTAADPATATPTTQPPGPLRPVIVHPGDSFAGLAEANGITDWPTLWPANDDRPEPNAQHFTDPALIRPGWTVLLPANPNPPVAPRYPQPASPPPTMPPSPQPAPTRSAPTTGSSSPPPATSPTAAGTSTPVTSSGPGSDTPTERAAPRSRSPVSNGPHHFDSSELPGLVWGGTGTLLAGLCLAALLGRRRRQQRHRRPGRTVASPPPRLRATERQLATHAGVSGIDAEWLTSALRTLVDALSSNDALNSNTAGQLPDITAAHLNGDTVELMLATPNRDVPPPWTSDDSGTRWRLAHSQLPADIGSVLDRLAPYPALTSVGLSPDADQWLIDLEHFHTIALSGPPEPRRNLLRYFAAELAHNTWAEQLHVSLVGFGREIASINPTRVTYHEQLPTAIDQVRAHLVGISEAATQTGTTILDGRLHDIAGDAWTPHLLLIDLPDDTNPATRDHAETITDSQPQITSSDPTALARLVNDLANAPTRAGIAIVLAANEPFPGTNCEMTITADAMLAIPELALHARACQLSTTEAEDLTDLLAVAANLADQPMPDARGDAAWDAYADAAGAPRQRLRADSAADPAIHTNNAPRAQTARPDRTAGLDEATTEDGDEDCGGNHHHVDGDGDAAPTRTMLMLPDQVYLAKAATTAHDLDTLAPPLPEKTRHEITSADTGLDADLAAWRDPDSRVPRLRLLGPVELTGAGPAPEGRGALLTELIAYLRTRPRGATVEELAAALWPHIPNAGSKTTPRQCVSAARQWLGVSERTQRERLPRATADAGGARLYRITDVLVDAELFRRLRLRANTRGQAGINDLQAALDLVSGPPFAHRRPGGYSWLADTPLNHEYTAMIIDVAHLVATHHLATGNPDAAGLAAHVSLSVEAGDDVALLDLLAAAEARGNDAEARTHLQRIMANHDAEIEEDLPPRTYEVLLRRGSIERLGAPPGIRAQ